jgi:hypothetical protein
MSTDKEIISRYGEMTIANYLVSSYDDLSDIVTTIEKQLAEKASDSDHAALRKICSISATPLDSKSPGFILRVKLPVNILSGIQEQSEMSKAADR